MSNTDEPAGKLDVGGLSVDPDVVASIMTGKPIPYRLSLSQLRTLLKQLEARPPIEQIVRWVMRFWHDIPDRMAQKFALAATCFVADMREKRELEKLAEENVRSAHRQNSPIAMGGVSHAVS
jgi:hypothetical protein